MFIGFIICIVLGLSYVGIIAVRLMLNNVVKCENRQDINFLVPCIFIDFNLTYLSVRWFLLLCDQFAGEDGANCFALCWFLTRILLVVVCLIYLLMLLVCCKHRLYYCMTTKMMYFTLLREKPSLRFP